MKKDAAYRARIDARKAARDDRPMKRIADALVVDQRRAAVLERRRTQRGLK